MHSFIPGKFISWYIPGRLFRPTYLPGRGQKTWPDAGVENEVENIANLVSGCWHESETCSPPQTTLERNEAGLHLNRTSTYFLKIFKGLSQIFSNAN